MADYKIGDVIKRKNGNDSLFMIVDIVTPEGVEKDIDLSGNIFYETMKIFPIEKVSQYLLVDSNDVVLHTENGVTEHKILLQFIKKEREKRGWFDIPDFIQVAEQNIVNKFAKASAEALMNTGEVKVKIVQKKYDVIRYDLINSVDECLDAINDLNILYEMFGDEAYIQLKELVAERIKEITVK